MHPRVSQSVAPPTSKAGKQNNQDTLQMVVSSWEYQLWSISGRTGTITALKFEFWLLLAPGLLVSLSCAESVSLAFLEICEIPNTLSIKSILTKNGQRWFLQFCSYTYNSSSQGGKQILFLFSETKFPQ